MQESESKYEQQFATAYRLIETNPDEAIRLFELLKKQAQTDRQHRWFLRAEFWILQTLMYIQQNYKAAHRRVVQDLLLVAKPEYEIYPEALAMRLELLAVYEAIDPVGYAPEIIEGLDFLEDKLVDNEAGRYSLPNKRINMLTILGKINEAKATATAYLHLVAGDVYNRDYYSAIAYIQLCEIAYFERDWHSLMQHTIAGDKYVQWAEQTYQRALLAAWRAVAYQMQGEETKARLEYIVATNIVAQQAQRVPHRTYYQAMGAYLEARGNLDEALRLYQHHMTALRESNRLYWACHAGIRRIGWLRQQNKTYAEDEQTVRAMAEDLRSKEVILELLAEAMRL
jgi:hypothetical protein